MGRSISDPRLLADLRDVAEKLGKNPTTTEYDEHGTYSVSVFYHRFHTWTEAKREAGLDTPPDTETAMREQIAAWRERADQIERSTTKTDHVSERTKTYNEALVRTLRSVANEATANVLGESDYE